jgi:vitamin B12 transporter
LADEDFRNSSRVRAGGFTRLPTVGLRKVGHRFSGAGRKGAPFMGGHERECMRRVFAGVVCAVVLSAASVFGQAQVSIQGAVRDASGGALPGATVTVVVADRAVVAATAGGDGRYQVQAPAGVPLELQVQLEGFADQAIEIAGIERTLTRDIVLQIGRVSDRLVVTASRGTESRASVTQSVTVATTEDIQALGAGSLADVMRFVPGVAVEGAGRDGAVTTMFSRGGESDYNLVLIDGVRVNQNGGLFDFSRISAADIERVEVVRGAQSSLWGSDAMGSVVQILTKRAGASDAPRLSGTIEGGSFQTWRGDAHLTGGARGRVDYQAGLSHRRTQGAFAGILAEDDEFEQSGVNAGVGVMLGNRASLRTGGRSTRAIGRSVGPITFGSRDTGARYVTEDLSWHADLSHTLGSRYTGTGNVNYFHYDSRSEDTVGDPSYGVFAILEGTPNAIFPDGMRLVRLITQGEFAALSAAGAQPAAKQFLASTTSFDFAPSRNLTQVRRPALRYQGDLTWAAGQRLSAGYEWEQERRPEQIIPATSFSPSTVQPELHDDNNAYFIQQQFSVRDRWFVTVGARTDVKESFGTFFSPKLSAGGFIVPARGGGLSSVKVFGNVGKGIKSPTFSERFGASFADPNEDLKVERARTTDIGVEATFADQRLRGGVTYFDNDYEDQIAFRFGNVGDGLPEFINIDGSKADGWELELALQRPVAGLVAGVTYSLVDTEVVTNLSTSQQFLPGQPLLRRPKHSGTVRLGYSVGRLSANFDTRWVGDRHDNSFLFLRTVANAAGPAFTTDITVNPGYAVSGFGVEFAAAREATLFFRANNVGDTAYDAVLGYPGMPRTLMAGVRFNVGR